VPEFNQNEINRVSKLTEEAIRQRMESKQKLKEAKDFVESLIKKTNS